MPCARLKPLPPMTKRQLYRLAGTDYDCLKDGAPDPTCRQRGRCNCLDREVVDSTGPLLLCGVPDGKVCACGYLADYLCDWPMGEGKTCDAPLCEDHAIPPEVDLSALRLSEMAARREPDLAVSAEKSVAALADLHLCPAHWAMSKDRERRP